MIYDKRRLALSANFQKLFLYIHLFLPDTLMRL